MARDDFLSRFGVTGEARPDPVRAVQEAMRPQLPKRFYADAAVIERDGLFHVGLDGRVARTPARRPLAVPDPALAGALVAEWRSQATVIDPAAMPLTRLVNSALDGVADQVEAVRAEIVRYAGSDALCYRAGEPEALVARQTEAWDPVLRWARTELGARFVLAEGVIFVAQPAEALAAFATHVAAVPAPLVLAGVHAAMTLTGSAILAMALRHRHLAPGAVWAAAHIEETWQSEIWGHDAEASQRLAARRTEFDAAVLLALGPPEH